MATLLDSAPHSGSAEAASDPSIGEAFEPRTLRLTVTFGRCFRFRQGTVSMSSARISRCYLDTIIHTVGRGRFKR
jgi:hypothetical protein